MRNLPIIFQAGALPEGFTGTPQEFYSTLVERLTGYVQNDYSIFVTGSLPPTSNVGPWLKDGIEWRFWSDATGSYSISSVPVGSIQSFAGNTPPAGYLLCQGQVVDKIQYADLYAVIGTLWNTGGELGTQFRLPDVAGRSPMFAGSGSGLTTRALATKLGEEGHILSGAESGQLNFTFLTDDGDSQTGSFGSCAGATLNGVQLLPFGSPPNATINTQAFANNQTAHNTIHPSVVFNAIIKY